MQGMSGKNKASTHWSEARKRRLGFVPRVNWPSKTGQPLVDGGFCTSIPGRASHERGYQNKKGVGPLVKSQGRRAFLSRLINRSSCSPIRFISNFVCSCFRGDVRDDCLRCPEDQDERFFLGAQTRRLPSAFPPRPAPPGSAPPRPAPPSSARQVAMLHPAPPRPCHNRVLYSIGLLGISFVRASGGSSGMVVFGTMESKFICFLGASHSAAPRPAAPQLPPPA